MSLGLTSLCQVTTKHRALLDTTVVPVNKYDLNNGSLTAAVSALFSTDALAVTDEVDESSVAEEEDGTGRLIKTTQCYAGILEKITRVS